MKPRNEINESSTQMNNYLSLRIIHRTLMNFLNAIEKWIV